MTESILKETISSRFNQVRIEKRIALMPFVMAGDPDMETSAQILLSLQDYGADIIELGIPYSDPLADGPVIQAAASRALRAGTTPAKVFEMLSSLKCDLSIPLVLFTYTNPLLNLGMEKFCDDAAKSGVSGIVIPDLPLEEAALLSPLAKSRGLDLVLLVAPTTPLERMELISQRSSGFTYLVSLTGVTGERSEIDAKVGILVQQLKQHSSIPIAVGFGISGPDQVNKVRGWGADGAIVGSAFVKRIANATKDSAAREAGLFCKSLRAATS